MGLTGPANHREWTRAESSMDKESKQPCRIRARSPVRCQRSRACLVRSNVRIGVIVCAVTVRAHRDDGDQRARETVLELDLIPVLTANYTQMM